MTVGAIVVELAEVPARTYMQAEQLGVSSIGSDEFADLVSAYL
ncbi:hypothetical protein [Streptomyces sp. NPDC050485]